MMLAKAFRYHRVMDDLFIELDKKMHPARWKVLLLCLRVVKVTGLSKVFARYVRGKLPSRNPDIKVVGVVMTKNHGKMADLMWQETGTELWDIGGAMSDRSTLQVKKVPDSLLPLALLANARSFLELVDNNILDSVMQRNTLRVAKLGGFQFIFKQMIQGKKVLVHFNDHSAYNVLLHDMAKENRMQTVYIQHATVTDRFPQLYHDLNVLYSDQSAEKYKATSEDGIRIIGDIRFVAEGSRNVTANYNNNVLICLNKRDSMPVVTDLAKKLIEKEYMVKIRPHPNDTKDWAATGIEISNSGQTSIWEDLAEASIVLFNESGVALEAISHNKYVYKCAFFGESYDNYGFLNDGFLLNEYESIDNLLMAIEGRVLTYDSSKLGYYIGDIKNFESRIKNLWHEISNF